MGICTVDPLLLREAPRACHCSPTRFNQARTYYVFSTLGIALIRPMSLPRPRSLLQMQLEPLLCRLLLPPPARFRAAPPIPLRLLQLPQRISTPLLLFPVAAAFPRVQSVCLRQ